MSPEVTREIIGAFYSVYNELGHGYLESVYVTALMYELHDRGLRADREVPIEVVCKGRAVGFFRADILVEAQTILEVKSSVNIVPADHRQVINYLNATNLSLGFLLHFGQKARFHRYISARKQKSTPPRL